MPQNAMAAVLREDVARDSIKTILHNGTEMLQKANVAGLETVIFACSVKKTVLFNETESPQNQTALF
ncbi:hypothetical protein CEXT_681441 [Caerostris extrusa]|uniref:Uncharacterized protein n=1 Tax=Caerostris extrusa TaxID=172846 RepID=A0AAV4R9L4_CAEEX|nr:hypothetical protein CEXT_681441 [Caerostris extrusa]